MKLLDLFCGAGGASVGYYRAGFEVTGVDIVDQPCYPFPFVKADALALDYELLMSFDAIHASPLPYRSTIRRKYCNDLCRLHAFRGNKPNDHLS